MHDLHGLFEKDKATTLTVQDEPLPGLRDALIIGANDKAARVYGLTVADDLIGKFLSELQQPSIRLAERITWYQRNLGYDVPKTYFSIIQRPDKKAVGVLKETKRFPLAIGGYKKQPVQMTTLEIANEWGSPPDITGWDVDINKIRKDIGFTVEECQNPDILDQLCFTENLRKLILEHRDLLSSVGGKKFAWSSVKDTIKQRYECEKCQNIWFGKLGMPAPQCDPCRSQPGRGKAYDGKRRG